MVTTDNWKIKTIFQDRNQQVFSIPTYQRGFDWNSDPQVNDFLNDLEEADTTNGGISDNHFFGLVYTEPEVGQRDSFRVIDGQQRLITSTLFFLCVRDIIHYFSKDVDHFCSNCNCGIALDETTRISEGTLDPEAEVHISDIEKFVFRWDRANVRPNLDLCILQLSRPNQEFFQNYLIKKETPENKIQSMNVQSKNYSEEKIMEAYKTIYNRLVELKEKYPKTRADGSTITFFDKLWSMVDTLLQLFDIVHVSVTNEEEAYEMFNLVNNRGLPLQNADLIKHQIFIKLYQELSSAPDRDRLLNDYDEKWSEIINAITGSNKGDYSIINFMHHYLVTFRKKDTKVKQSLSVVKELLNESGGVKPSVLLNDMKSWADHFNSLRNPGDRTFETVLKVQYYLDKIKQLGAIALYPIVLAGFDKLWQTGELTQRKIYGDILQICFRNFVRNKTIGSANPTQLESKMRDVAEGIRKQDWIVPQVKNCLVEQNEKTYTPKTTFEQQLVSDYNAKDSTVATYLLEELENMKDPAYFSQLDGVTVEHIMPRSIKKWRDDIIQWQNFSGTEDEKTKQANEFKKKYLYKIGNLTLLHGTKNTKAGNKKFADKIPIYQNDGYKITVSIAQTYTNWKETNILARHNEICIELKKMFDIESY
tara:strand:+ start:1252 stop:3195 length:1944 start_codon:yes stop_codon:yes gene_type:complete